jgi:hypothetical protein
VEPGPARRGRCAAPQLRRIAHEKPTYSTDLRVNRCYIHGSVNGLQ